MAWSCPTAARDSTGKEHGDGVAWDSVPSDCSDSVADGDADEDNDAEAEADVEFVGVELVDGETEFSTTELGVGEAITRSRASTEGALADGIGLTGVVAAAGSAGRASPTSAAS